MKRRKKHIVIRYQYANSTEGESALEEVFDDIFKRIFLKIKNKNISKNEAGY